jgi:hypothetical protein
VYLAPLVSELNELWEVGVQTFDVTSKKKFTMHSALMWMINDFPAYGDLSSWCTHGKKACPCFRHSTKSTWLIYGKNIALWGIGDGCLQNINGEGTRDHSTMSRKWMVHPKCWIAMRS